MAAKPFSNEQLNFLKFSTLVLGEFPKVLRQIFINMWDTKIAGRPGFIPWDDSPEVRTMLFTSEGGKTDIPTTRSIGEWDCTSLFKATIYAKTFGISKGSTLNDLYLKKIKPAPGCFHASVESSSGNQDETRALVIDQLRLLRNRLCHSPKSEMAKSDFDNYVQLAGNALLAVNIDTTFVYRILQMNENDFPTEKAQELYECRMNELRAISLHHESVEQDLSVIKEQTRNMEQKLLSIEGQTGKIGNVEEKLSTVNEKVEKMSLKENISREEKTNVPG